MVARFDYDYTYSITIYNIDIERLFARKIKTQRTAFAPWVALEAYKAFIITACEVNGSINVITIREMYQKVAQRKTSK